MKGLPTVGSRVAMLVLNTCATDTRVIREALLLQEAGATVEIFAISGLGLPPGQSVEHGLVVNRVDASPHLTLVRRARPDTHRPAPAGPRRSAAPRPSRAGLRRTALRVHRTIVPVAFAARVVGPVRRFRPDVVHAHDLNTGIAAGLATRRSGSRLLYDSHELWLHRNKGGELRPAGQLVERLLERWLVARVDAVVTVSPGIASWLTHHYRLRVPVHLVRNVPDSRWRSVTRSVRALRTSQAETVLLYIGRVSPGRGLEVAVDALQHLPAHVVVAVLGYGDPRLTASLVARAEQAGTGDRLRILDPVAPDEVLSVAAEADIALLPGLPVCLSYRYALPNKLFEAWQAGLPVVTSDLPDISALVEEYDAGVTYSAGSPSALAAAVRAVLADPQRFRAGARRAGHELTWAAEGLRLLDAYVGLGILAPSGRPADGGQR